MDTPKKQEERIGQPSIRITKNLLQGEWELIVVTEVEVSSVKLFVIAEHTRLLKTCL